MENIYKELADKNLLNKEQFDFLDAIRSNKIISLFFELRLILYVGILLFTGAVGYLAYQNMGSIGHLTMMLLIATGIFFCFRYIKIHALPFSNLEVTVEHRFFDYLLLLSALLIISLLTYVQVYFEIVQYMLNTSSYLTAGILLFMAYRYDNRALLSMGITAIAAAVGISITPIDWVKGDWFANDELYVTYMLLGLVLISFGELTYRKGIKKHFRFLLQNFGLILFYLGCSTAMFDSDQELLFAIICTVSALAASYISWHRREFVLFLYSNIAAYTASTYLLVKLINYGEGLIFIIYYIPFSCILYTTLLIQNKKHFNNDREDNSLQ